MRFLIRVTDVLYDLYILLRNLVISLFGPRPVYVLLELSGPYPEHRPRRRWRVRSPQSLDDLRDQLDLIAANERAAGVVITAHALETGFASIQGIRTALLAFRKRGKRVIAYLPQANTRLYYLASAADTIVMPEAGILDLVGLQVGVTFLKEALDRIGVVGEFEQIAEYKGAVEPFTRRTMSEPMRESLNAILDSVFEDVLTQTAAARRLDPAALRGLMDQAPLSAREALEAGLLDALCFEDELPRFLRAKPQRAPVILPWPLARKRLRKPFRWRTPGQAIALIGVQGAIHMGESRTPPPVPIPVLGGASTGHATIARAFRAVERNPLFGAIILSIDSPGGSALASELIWREVDRMKRVKPVVAYMSNVAGSGGYYVAAGCNRIVAQSATLTGSIGVVSGKFTVRGLAARVGITRETLVRGEAAAMASPFTPFSPEEWRRLQKQMDEIYTRFVHRVAAGRHLAREDVATVARGRVWTGRQALELGLVDRLGDFSAAVVAAKELMGVPESRGVAVVQIRPPRSVPVRGPGLLAELGDLWTSLTTLFEERVLALMPWEISLK
jgi:protease-4